MTVSAPSRWRVSNPKNPEPSCWQSITTIFLEPNSSPQKHAGICDIAFIGGTFTITPNTLSWLQLLVQRYCYWRKESWTTILNDAYVIHYQPDPAALAFLKEAPNLPIRYLYFWPLELAQRLLKRHGQFTWSCLWLGLPSGAVSILVYHNDRPLFCRTLATGANPITEITATQQYIKRFGYDKSQALHVFIPESLTKPDLTLEFITYDHIPFTKPIASLSALELARNLWLARIPRAIQIILIVVLLIGIYGATLESLRLVRLSNQQQELQVFGCDKS